MPQRVAMRSLETKVPPPIVALLMAALMWVASLKVPSADVPLAIRVTVAVVVALAGLAVGVAAIVSFRRARTTVNPLKPNTASSLVTGCIFRFTRNAMYVSMLVYLLAWAVYLSSWLALVCLPIFVFYIDRFQIGPEERALEALFGQEYATYKERVRRWL